MAALAFAAAGCGGGGGGSSASGTKPETWAADVCGALQTWTDDLKSGSQNAELRPQTERRPQVGQAEARRVPRERQAEHAEDGRRREGRRSACGQGRPGDPERPRVRPHRGARQLPARGRQGRRSSRRTTRGVDRRASRSLGTADPERADGDRPSTSRTSRTSTTSAISTRRWPDEPSCKPFVSSSSVRLERSRSPSANRGSRAWTARLNSCLVRPRRRPRSWSRRSRRGAPRGAPCRSRRDRGSRRSCSSASSRSGGVVRPLRRVAVGDQLRALLLEEVELPPDHVLEAHSELPVELEVGLRRLRPRSARAARARLRRGRCCERRRIVEQLARGLGERVEVARRHDPTRLEAAHRLGDPAHVVGDDRNPGAERAQQRPALVDLGPVRKERDRRLAERPVDLVLGQDSRGATPLGRRPRPGSRRCSRADRRRRAAAPRRSASSPRSRRRGPCTRG